VQSKNQFGVIYKKVQKQHCESIGGMDNNTTKACETQYEGCGERDA
jgi:hypothetical protein